MTIKSNLIKRLLFNGFSNQFDKNTFKKSSGRESVTYTLRDKMFEVYVRCYPAKEGWSMNTYSYTRKNTNNLIMPHY